MADLKTLVATARRRQLGTDSPGPDGRMRAAEAPTRPGLTQTRERRNRLPLAEFAAMFPDRLAPAPGPDEFWDFYDLVGIYFDPGTPGDRAMTTIRSFVNAGGAMKIFPNLDRVVFAYQLALRIANPSRIDQGRSGLCGPTAIAVNAARSDPAGFAAFATSLAGGGHGMLGRFSANATEDLRSYELQERQMPAVDFVVLTCLRSSDTVLSEETDLSRYHGMSLQHLFDWMVQIGYPAVEMLMAPPAVELRRNGVKVGGYKLLQRTIFGVARALTAVGYDMPVYKTWPVVSAPMAYPCASKQEVLERLIDRLSQGAKIFVLGNAQMGDAAEEFERALRYFEVMEATTPEDQRGALFKESHQHGIREATRQLERAAERPHWMLLDEVLVSGDKITVTLVHHGKRSSFQGLPLNGFLFQFGGYVAASPARRPARRPVPGMSQEAPF